MDVVNLVTHIGWLPAICYVLGLIFVIFEMFAPGFGVPGITGIVLLILGVALSADTLMEALIFIIFIIIILAIAFMIVLRSATKGRLSKTLVLTNTMKKESGFISTDDLQLYIGKEGIASSILRPSGTGDFDGVKLDVVSEAEYIPKGTKIKIVKVIGRRVVVQEIKS